MKEIRINPTMQLLTLLAVLGAVGAVIAAQLPEVRRYLKVRSM
jgi:hypothetical protein